MENNLEDKIGKLERVHNKEIRMIDRIMYSGLVLYAAANLGPELYYETFEKADAVDNLVPLGIYIAARSGGYIFKKAASAREYMGKKTYNPFRRKKD